MKATEYSGELFDKSGEVYTKFAVGHKANPRIEQIIELLGGVLTKSTTRAKYYEVKGDKLYFMMLV